MDYGTNYAIPEFIRIDPYPECERQRGLKDIYRKRLADPLVVRARRPSPDSTPLVVLVFEPTTYLLRSHQTCCDVGEKPPCPHWVQPSGMVRSGFRENEQSQNLLRLHAHALRVFAQLVLASKLAASPMLIEDIH